MPLINLLKESEISEFENPIKLTDKEKDSFFLFKSADFEKLNFRKKISQIGFILQLGYFKSNKKFFNIEQFYEEDIKHVSKLLDIDNKINIFKYGTILYNHRKKILDILGYRDFNSFKPTFEKEAEALVKTSLKPKAIFYSLIDFLEEHKVEQPRYYVFAETISKALNAFEVNLTNQLDEILTEDKKKTLDDLIALPVSTDEKITAKNPYLITKLKKPIQSKATKKIQASMKEFLIVKDLYQSYGSTLHQMGLSEELLNYYASWVIKAEHIQFDSIRNPSLKRLYLICFIMYQYRLRQDYFIDTLLTSYQSFYNKAEQNANNNLIEQQTNQKYSNQKKNFNNIKNIVRSSRDEGKQARTILYKSSYNQSEQIIHLKEIFPMESESLETLLLRELNKIEPINILTIKNKLIYKELSKSYLKLQKKVSSIIKNLEFNEVTSDPKIMEAINFYKKHNGKLNDYAPMDFISDGNDRKSVKEDMKEHGMHLYKVILVKEICRHIKAGSLNLISSEKYKFIDEYLIDIEDFNTHRENYLYRANLEKLGDYNAFILQMKQELEDHYTSSNIKLKENSHIKFDKDGKPKVSTPKSKENELVNPIDLYGKDQYLSLTDVLSQLHPLTNIADCFTHFSRKTSKQELPNDVLFASIIGLGCNIGVRKMGKISKGITEDKLDYAVRWYFSKENLDQANKNIIDMTDELELSKLFIERENELHTSSDGQKFGVSVPSLHARYSYKYFGHGKGVTAYSFIDEKNRLFYNTVITASEREASSILDGLMHNEDIESTIHSSDTHGYTEVIFGICNALDILFAPRIKTMHTQKRYTFKENNRKYYEKREYKILPSKVDSYINIKLLEQQWENILRVLCSIKLKYSKASDILRRLNSYSKQNPLYKGLKELGKIYKTIFILRYYSEVELRQSIEKQLNKVELSHQFAKAIFFGNNQEFKVGTKEEQELALGCRHLIQNSIILYNYLFLSEKLSEIKEKEEYETTLEQIKQSSVMTWYHINLYGEYNFKVSNKLQFNLNKIQKLKLE
ncbi:transposase for transposon Tn1546 [Flavobacteriaceae bacterium UJ101]|nr:transposase for transposon Tn1546 [Flavobacteriaceae bacterium UJ101]